MLAQFDEGVGEHSFWVAVLLRLAPILPFGPTNYALGATRISPGMYALTTVVGTAPTNLMYAYAGSLLHRVTELGSPRTGHTIMLLGSASPRPWLPGAARLDREASARSRGDTLIACAVGAAPALHRDA